MAKPVKFSNSSSLQFNPPAPVKKQQITWNNNCVCVCVFLHSSFSYLISHFKYKASEAFPHAAAATTAAYRSFSKLKRSPVRNFCSQFKCHGVYKAFLGQERKYELSSAAVLWTACIATTTSTFSANETNGTETSPSSPLPFWEAYDTEKHSTFPVHVHEISVPKLSWYSFVFSVQPKFCKKKIELPFFIYFNGYISANRVIIITFCCCYLGACTTSKCNGYGTSIKSSYCASKQLCQSSVATAAADNG